MTNTKAFAIREFAILNETVKDAIIAPFDDEIIALCEKFGKSGQSGGSVYMTAEAISQAIKKLLIQQPICDIVGINNGWEQWIDITEMNCGELMYQNSRCSGLFKYGDGKCSYVDAIVWKGEEKWDTFTGSVYIDNVNFEMIGSMQNVRFPFSPKTFYIDVVRVPISKEEAESKNMHYIEDGNGDCYYSVVKNKKQLEKVFKYYDRKHF